MRSAPSRNGAARSSPGCSASRPLKNASRVKIEFRTSRVSEGSVFLRPPIWGISRGRSPLFNNPSVAKFRDVGARPGLFLLDLCVIEVVALALRVVARHAAADPVLRETLLRIAAILLFALRFGGLLCGFLGRLCLILLALAERLFLLGRGLGSGAFGRLAFCSLVGGRCSGSGCRGRGRFAGHSARFHVRRTRVLRIDDLA